MKKLLAAITVTISITIFLLSACDNPFNSSPKWHCAASHPVGNENYIGLGVGETEEEAETEARNDWEDKCLDDRKEGCEEDKDKAQTECDEI